MKYQIFISSVQNEFSKERRSLSQFIREDAFLNLFFEPLIFEDLSASGKSPKEIYLHEIEKSDVYVGLFGMTYGYEDKQGVSPTEREFDCARELNLPCWIFVSGADSVQRHEKMKNLIAKAESCVSRRRFENVEQLKIEVSKACLLFLRQNGKINLDDFDSASHPTATLDDISDSAILEFIRAAKVARNFPLKETDTKSKVLIHLNLLRNGRIANSALLAFANTPQFFFPTAVVKCAHFHGYEVQKPIPDFKEIRGNVFQMTDDAVDFVLSKISVSRGDRSLSNRVETTYEIPRSIISEAIINAIAHRDYYSKGSIQISVFKDRVEIENPGNLPQELDLANLREAHGSYPFNPLLANCMFLAGTIERYGTGIPEMFSKSAEKGLRDPVFSVEKSFRLTLWRPSAGSQRLHDIETESSIFLDLSPIQRVILIMHGEMKREEIQDALELKHRDNFRDTYLNPAIEDGLVAMTIPDKPTSSRQMYRLTKKGVRMQNLLRSTEG